MEIIEIIILLIILLLAIPFGYFLHKAINSVATKNLIEQLDRLKLIDSQRQTLVSQLKSENLQQSEAFEKLEKEYFQLTLASRDLEEKERNLQNQLLDKQYDVPPDYPHLQESNALLQKEIQRTREKISKWKSKDYVKANSKLIKKVKSLKNRVVALRDANTKYEQSHHILNQIKDLTENIDKNKTKEILPAPSDENPFAHQPAFSKKKIFQEIFPDSITEKPAMVIDLQSANKTLIDLVGMDKKSMKILSRNGINTFNDLVQTKIKQLKLLFEGSSAEYPFETWPIQARLALRGEWELIEEYKRKD